MLSVVQFKLKFPYIQGDLGMALNRMGKFVIIASVSAQAERYGVIKNDRILEINGYVCTGKDPLFVADLIKKFRPQQKLEILFERSFPVEDTPRIEQEIKAQMDNDSIFQEGAVHLRCNSNVLGNVYVRVLRMKGMLLPTANDLKLVPYSISVLYFNNFQDKEPISGFNLLPCVVSINKPDIENSLFSFKLASLSDIYTFTFSTKIEFNQWLLLICDLLQQDVQPLLNEFSRYLNTENEDTIQIKKKENDHLFKIMKNNLNIPVYSEIAQIYKDINDIVTNMLPPPAMKQKILLLAEQKAKLLDNGYAPTHIYHSVIAFLLTIYNKLKKKEEWDETVQTSIKDIATFFHHQQETYIRNNLIPHSGFLVFGCIDPDILGYYTPQTPSSTPIIYQNEAQTKLYPEAGVAGKLRWVFVKKDCSTPTFYSFGDNVVPPRFQWICDDQTIFTPIVQSIM